MILFPLVKFSILLKHLGSVVVIFLLFLDVSVDVRQHSTDCFVSCSFRSSSDVFIFSVKMSFALLRLLSVSAFDFFFPEDDTVSPRYLKCFMFQMLIVTEDIRWDVSSLAVVKALFFQH